MRFTQQQVQTFKKYKKNISEREIEEGKVEFKAKTLFWQEIKYTVKRIDTDWFVVERRDSYMEDDEPSRKLSGTFLQLRRTLKRWYGY